MILKHKINLFTSSHDKSSFPTCKIELSKLAAMVAVMMLGRIFCFAANEPGTYEAVPADEVCESKRENN